MGKRTIIKIVSFISATVLAVVGLSIMTHKRMENYRLQVGNAYSMHLDELDGSLYNISVALQKSLYASSATQMSSLAVELCTESTVAKNSLSQLPYSNEQSEGVNKFLSQVGDYTLYLSRKVIQGGEISVDERENLHNLSKIAQSVSSSVNVIRAEYDKEGVWDSQLAADIGKSVEGDFTESIESLEELLVDYPTLQYDGPFSDHLLNGEIKLTANDSELSAADALNRAAAILGVDPSSVSEEKETAGNVPCYNYTDGTMSFSVTKRGGRVMYMRKFREIGEQTIQFEEAVRKAEDYLGRVEGTSLVSTYYFADEGVCTVSFAHKEGATVCYPDLIKIGVALDNGEIVLVEAGGYIANHYTRTIETPKYTLEEARQKLSKALIVNGVKRCIIPSDGNAEKHCYEFDCIGIDGEELLVYINTQNLEEERILLLLKTDGGTLTK
ncbi:MAG: germination protein YpeB [Clostridia bacterium]|nr:germination protein YpeB [Clostridia bacterium]